MNQQVLLSNRLPPAVIALLQRWVSLHGVLWLLTLACFLVAWNRGLALLYGLFALSLALLLISHVMPWLQLRGVRVERSLPGDLSAGNPGAIAYRLSASGRRYHLQISDRLPFAEQGHPLFFSHSDSHNHQRQTFHCERRGRYLLRELTLSSAYPFGIVTRNQRIVTEPLEVLVLPRVFELSRIPLPVVADASSDGDLAVPQQGGHHEFAAVREYSHGDELRSIHWRASARRQQLVVKEYERSDRPTLLVALDCRPGFNQGEGSRSTFEYAVSIAASMIHFASRDGMQAILAADDGEWHEQVIPAYAPDLYILYELLARLDATGSESSARVAEQALVRFPRANLITGFRLSGDPELPALSSYLTHIDLEMDEESFLFPLKSYQGTGRRREGNRLIYRVDALTPLETLFQ
ncbi:MAG: DUF58 domain-containing protein [Candidatus Thiodiazotropha sp. (ex Dulcina madagascariensis)]|nr:DUF58 domain-containing protein [Candidatus Thiodiazotropha sp. (ex Dulcina madagascariensis)]